MDDYVEVRAHGTTYGVLAVEGDDGRFRPDVAELDAAGAPARKLVDAEWTDEAYGDARTCLLVAMQHVI